MITQEPGSLSLCVDYDALFSVTAAADRVLDPLNYQWFFNGNAIADATDATPVNRKGLLDPGTPKVSPRCVPVTMHLAAILSPSEIVSATST